MAPVGNEAADVDDVLVDVEGEEEEE